MTIEQVVVKYLYQTGKLSLNGLGTFRLESPTPDPEYIQKHRFLPVSGASFTYDPKVETEEAFIDFYAEQRSKIPSLAISDIYTFLQTATQLLNIGNPFELKGIGTLNKQNDGTLVMEPGYYVSLKDFEATPPRLRERQEVLEARMTAGDEDGSGGMSSGLKKFLMGFAAVLLLALGGWFVYQKMVAGGDAQGNAIPTEDTTAMQVPQVDTGLITPPAPIIPDSLVAKDWKVIFREIKGTTNALRRLQNYAGANPEVFMETEDSLQYRLYIIVTAPSTDTLRIKDSLSNFYARPVVLVPNQ